MSADPQARTATDLFAQARASEHAATVAVQRGDLPLAETHIRLGRLRRDLALDQAARECTFCNGYGATPEKCPAGCTEHDPHDRTARHWVPCISVVAHPPAADHNGPAPTGTDRCPCNPTGTRGYHKGGPACSVWEPMR
ncbi:hypothetical protein [Streptomyces hydrogenans]|uniref:hypothetical protein n=1 Tax=Streptomyces hydrogenans TaxID=1873719 RepID=UPI0038018AB0